MEKMPLSVTGRVNLIKMVWAPQLLYIFHNSPIWITHKWFTRIDAQFRDLIWGIQQARISMHSLQLAKDQGGMAVPHPRYYFVASQLQQLNNWGEVDPSDPIRSLLLPDGSSLPVLAHLEAGFTHLSYSLPTITLLNTLWKYVRSLLHIKGVCSWTPIWRNVYFKELLKLEDSRSWEAAGVHYIALLFSGTTLKSFTELSEEFCLPRTQFYRYLQLRHAIHSQGRVSPLGAMVHPLMNDVLSTDERKGMISRVYIRLLNL